MSQNDYICFDFVCEPSASHTLQLPTYGWGAAVCERRRSSLIIILWCFLPIKELMVLFCIFNFELQQKLLKINELDLKLERETSWHFYLVFYFKSDS